MLCFVSFLNENLIFEYDIKSFNAYNNVEHLILSISEKKLN